MMKDTFDLLKEYEFFDDLPKTIINKKIFTDALEAILEIDGDVEDLFLAECHEAGIEALWEMFLEERKIEDLFEQGSKFIEENIPNPKKNEKDRIEERLEDTMFDALGKAIQDITKELLKSIMDDLK